MGKVISAGKMEQLTMVSGNATKCMVKVSSRGKMADNMMESIKMI